MRSAGWGVVLSAVFAHAAVAQEQSCSPINSLSVTDETQTTVTLEWYTPYDYSAEPLQSYVGKYSQTAPANLDLVDDSWWNSATDIPNLPNPSPGYGLETHVVTGL